VIKNLYASEAWRLSGVFCLVTSRQGVSIFSVIQQPLRVPLPRTSWRDEIDTETAGSVNRLHRAC